MPAPSSSPFLALRWCHCRGESSLRGVTRATLATDGAAQAAGAELLGSCSLFGAAVVSAPLSVQARWNGSAVLVWACGVSSSLLEVRVIPLLESPLLG